MNTIRIVIGVAVLIGRWEDERSPRSCAALRERVPLSGQLIHARWSGEACWVPLGDLDVGVGAENPTAHPKPGEILFYPGGMSETELLIAYGTARFACNAGALEGNHVLTIVDGNDQLARLGADALWKGARRIVFE